MRIGQVDVNYLSWKKWLGIRWTNYDFHFGTGEKRWCGFQIDHGFATLRVMWKPKRKQKVYVDYAR